jgi:hypothetical protein
MVLDYNPEKFYLWGVFYMTGNAPKEFADFDCIEAAVNGNNNAHPGYITLYTRSDENHYDNAPATFALVTERRLFFVTSRARDSEFEYRFEGEFLRDDYYVLAGKNKAVLRGTLTKMKNHRTIAQRKVSFRMEDLGC